MPDGVEQARGAQRRSAARAAPPRLLALVVALLLHMPPATAAKAGTLPRPATALTRHQLDALQRRFPWEISPEQVPHLPWEGLQSNLTALLEVQARDNGVAIIVFNEGFSQLALNCLVSLITYGNSPNYIVTAVGEGSLAYCRALRLPCYDGSLLLLQDGDVGNGAGGVSGGGGGGSSDGDGSSSRELMATAAAPDLSAAGPGAAAVAGSGSAAGETAAAAAEDAPRYTEQWFQLVWIKTLIAHAVNARGYDILFADADTVFLKDAWATYNELLDMYDADGTFMYEQANVTRSDNTSYIHKYLNSGNFLLRSNSRTRNLMEMWRVGYEFQLNVNGNQLWLNRLEKLGYKLCHDPATCSRHREEGWAAIKPHPNQFYGVGQMCTPDKLEEGLCADRRLYVHAVCRSGHKQKIWALMQLGLWFIDVDTHDPTKVTVQLPHDGSLPCRGPTWSDEYPFSS